MKGKRLILGILLSTACLCLFDACSSSKRLGRHSRQLRELQTAIDRNNWIESVDSKCQLKFERLSSAAQLKIESDTCLWASVQPLRGLEIYRLWLNGDQADVIDRNEKIHHELVLDDFFENAGFPVALLSALLTDRMAVSGIARPVVSDFSVTKSSDQAAWDLLYSDQDMTYVYSLDSIGQLVSAVIEIPRYGSQASFRYADFRDYTEGTFPHRVKIDFTSDLLDRAYSAELVYTRISFNTHPKMNRSIPSSYRKSDLPALRQMLSL